MALSIASHDDLATRGGREARKVRVGLVERGSTYDMVSLWDPIEPPAQEPERRCQLKDGIETLASNPTPQRLAPAAF